MEVYIFTGTSSEQCDVIRNRGTVSSCSIARLLRRTLLPTAAVGSSLGFSRLMNRSKKGCDVVWFVIGQSITQFFRRSSKVSNVLRYEALADSSVTPVQAVSQVLSRSRRHL